MAENVASLWVTIGAKPVIGRYKKPLKNSGFCCPTLDFALRNPLEIVKEAMRVKMNTRMLVENSLRQSKSMNLEKDQLVSQQ